MLTVFFLAINLLTALQKNIQDKNIQLPELSKPVYESEKRIIPDVSKDLKLPIPGSMRSGPVIPSTTTYGVHTPGGSIPKINVPFEGASPGTVIPGITEPNVTQPENTFPDILPEGTTIPSPFKRNIPY